MSRGPALAQHGEIVLSGPLPNLTQILLVPRAETPPSQTTLSPPRRIKPGATAGIAIAAVAVLTGIVVYFIVLHCYVVRRRSGEELREDGTGANTNGAGDRRNFPIPKFILPVYSKFASPKPPVLARTTPSDLFTSIIVSTPLAQSDGHLPGGTASTSRIADVQKTRSPLVIVSNASPV